MSDEPHLIPMPYLAVYRLNEGYVLNHGEYGIAITNAADLAKRVREIAEQDEVVFQGTPLTGEVDITDSVFAVEGPPPEQPEPINVQETASVLQAAPDGVVPTTQLEGEWKNVRMMMAFFAAGFDKNGRAFTRKEWDAALPEFAPHIDPKEAEFALSEFLADLRDDDE